MERNAAGATTSPCEFACEGDYWTIQFAERDVRVRDSKGMRYLAELLAHPGREISAGALASGQPVDHVSVGEARDAALVERADSDVGPLLDAQAKSAYRARLAELESDREEAERHRDPERAARAPSSTRRSSSSSPARWGAADATGASARRPSARG